MNIEELSVLIHVLSLAGVIGPVEVADLGILIQDGKGCVPIGGNISWLKMGERVQLALSKVLFKADCGHVINNYVDISGQCSECNRILCSLPECRISHCEVLHLPVCSQCSEIIDGVVVSNRAKKQFMWRWQVRKIAMEKKKNRS